MLKAIVMGPVNLLLLAGEYLGAGAVSLWTALSAVGLALGSTARAVRSSIKLAPTMTAAAKDLHSQVGFCTKLKCGPLLLRHSRLLLVAGLMVGCDAVRCSRGGSHLYVESVQGSANTC